jgi:hypothetical protein
VAKQTQQQQLDMLTQAVAAIAASLQPQDTEESEPQQSKQSKPQQSKTVKAENAGEPPTSKQSYILLMRARENGLDAFSMPTTRGAAADLIGAVLSAKTKAAKVKALTQ